MAKVKNIEIQLQSGSNNTYFATWQFEESVTVTKSTGKIKVGDWVTIKSGARWWNGAGIPSYVFGREWQVYEVGRRDPNRIVLNRDRSGSYRIMSPIHVQYLNGGSGSSTTTTVTENTVDHYTASWTYDTGDGVWFSGSSSDVKEKLSTYNAPDNAKQIKLTVTPVSKTRQVNGKDTAYWTGTGVSAIWNMSYSPPEVPPSPSISVEKYDLTATVDNVTDGRCDEIEFQIYDMTTLFAKGRATVSAAMASYQCKVNAGGSYRVRCRAVNLIDGGEVYSDWTDFTSAVSTIPAAPAEITKIRGSSSTSVYLEWSTVNSADTYDVEYTTKLSYFDGSSETTTVSGIEFTHYEVTGLESGDEYFFRVRAVNDQGESAWTEPKSVVIGKKPAAPTTWSSATTVITGEPLRLYWVHNAEDGSTEEYAEVEITIGTETETETVKNELADDEDNPDRDKTKYYEIDTSAYTEGTQIKWRVRTAGITLQYGDWSVQRTVDIYAPPTLALSLTNQNGEIIEVINTFPCYVKGLAGPSTQMPIGYHVTVVANEGYNTVDSVGRNKIINAGDEVYSSYIDTNDPLLLELSANNIDLQNNISYTVFVVVSMNSGLTTQEDFTFEVSWTDEEYNIDAEIAIDSESYVAFITPYCRSYGDGTEISDVTLAVYRREFDGTYQEIASGIDPTKNTVVTDPHPALDYARYRIVATSISTGAVSFYDPPGYPMPEQVPVILQWAEAWTEFDVTAADITDERAEPIYNGSILKLPYNIDVSDNNTPEASLVKYIGRMYPVSYYGTQIDSSSTWNIEIDKEDKDTLYALRRLSIWTGDVYVREPSGSGYWANVNVSFSQKHSDLTIPVTLSITRVEGGI